MAPADGHTRVSVIVPLHNEGPHLAAAFQRFWEELGDLRADVGRVVLVENGSRDDTLEVARSLARARLDTIVVDSIQRASYGAAVRSGMQRAGDGPIVILECDLLDVVFLRRAIRAITFGEADFVVGSKRMAGSDDRRPRLRRWLTVAYNVMLRGVSGFAGTDTRGLKAMRGDVARTLGELCVTEGETFQTEMTILAWRLGYRVLEVPITVSEGRRPSRAPIARIPATLGGLIALRRSIARFPSAGGGA